MGRERQDRQRDILIVDDLPANLVVLRQMLLQHGNRVRAVTSGARALAAVRAEPPDVILLDIKMPEMDGYEVCQHLKADAATRDIPVLFISALDQVDDKVKAFTAGGVDYITKPFQLEEVVARLETHLALRDLREELERANAELARRLDELAQVNAELQARNDELDTYAHTVAHDLKNPLGLIIGYADMLALQDVPAEDQGLRQGLDAIARGGRKMLNIIDELLLLSSVRSVDEVDAEALDTGAIVTAAWERLAVLAADYGAEIILPESWPSAVGHSPWVEQVWVNYLSNAIKYGGSPPRVEVGAVEQADGMVCFWVRDNGDGLTKEEIDRLFSPFERLDRARASGHGLGLSIVRHIVAKLGGEAWAESAGRPGQGSTFSFTLPAAPGRQPAPQSKLGKPTNSEKSASVTANRP